MEMRKRSVLFNYYVIVLDIVQKTLFSLNTLNHLPAMCRLKKKCHVKLELTRLLAFFVSENT